MDSLRSMDACLMSLALSHASDILLSEPDFTRAMKTGVFFHLMKCFQICIGIQFY